MSRSGGSPAMGESTGYNGGGPAYPGRGYGGYAGDYGRNAGVLYAQPGYAPDYGFHTAPRPAPDAESINGKAVYIFGSGADRMRKTEGKLVLCSQSGEIKIEVSGHGPLSAAEFAKLAKNQWKRPRQNIKLAQSDQTLEDFEYVMNAVPPGTCRRYPFERDTEEQQRAEQADTVRMRQLKRQHERNLRRSMKRKVAADPGDVGVVGKAELPELRAGTWADAEAAAGAKMDDAEFQKKTDKAHKTWKKNSSLLYDLVMIQVLETPSLTVQWLPETRPVPGYPDFVEHRFLIGTYSSTIAQEEVVERTEKRGRKPAPRAVPRDYLIEAGVQFPRSIGETREDMNTEERAENNELYKQAQVDVIGKYGHQGEVNRARYLPQNPRIIATKSGGDGGELYLFDLDALGDRLLTNKAEFSADHYVTLRGHTKEGYGLCWNERKAGYLLSGSYDHRVCVWDAVGGESKVRGKEKQLDPLNTFNGHSDYVADVAWSPHEDSVFYSVGDDKKLFIWDLRNARKATSSHVISQWAVNSVDCNTFNEHILATGSGTKGQGVVRIWDDRNMQTPLYELTRHFDVVEVVSWSPHHPHVLASGSRDRKVQLINTQKAQAAAICPQKSPLKGGRPVAPMEDSDPREVMFVHAGHWHNVSDISWNHEYPWLISSVSDAEDFVQFWQPTQRIWSAHTNDADERDENSMESDDDEEEPAAAAAAAVAASGGQDVPSKTPAIGDRQLEDITDEPAAAREAAAAAKASELDSSVGAGKSTAEPADVEDGHVDGAMDLDASEAATEDKVHEAEGEVEDTECGSQSAVQEESQGAEHEQAAIAPSPGGMQVDEPGTEEEGVAESEEVAVQDGTDAAEPPEEEDVKPSPGGMQVDDPCTEDGEVGESEEVAEEDGLVDAEPPEEENLNEGGCEDADIQDAGAERSEREEAVVVESEAASAAGEADPDAHVAAAEDASVPMAAPATHDVEGAPQDGDSNAPAPEP